MDVYILTNIQKDLVYNNFWSKDVKFNPFYDFYDNWCLTVPEVEDYEYTEFLWLKNCPKIIYVPKL